MVGMPNSFWFYVCTFSLQALWICGTCDFMDDPSTLVILKYFHPPNDDSFFDEDCSDPCTLNVTLLSKRREKMERRGCRTPHLNCRENINSPYRSINGSCNNLLNPDWGMAETCHRRFLPHDYADGVSYPRKSCLKVDLPNARDVSNLLHRVRKPRNQMDLTLHAMEWGQVISHDVSLAQTENIPDVGPGSCCDPYPRIDNECIAVRVPYDDDFYPGKRSCLAFQRTRMCHLCTGGVRQSLNNNTSFLDLSIVYGSTEETMRSLRSYANGKLRTQNIPGVGALPPPIEQLSRCKAYNSSLQCFNGGDRRINQNVLLSSVQTILLRNHNNLCQKLKEINPHWDDDTLFQEARRINIAQAQMITFGEFLKNILGRGITSNPEFQLNVLPGRQFTTYYNTIDPSITGEFAVGAHRFGHTMIPNTLFEKDPVTGRIRTIHIKDYLFWPFDFYHGQLDRLALGMAIEHPKHRTITLNSEVRNYLYDMRNETQFHGTDLAATSIVRGRDHGFPGYTHYIKYLFNYHIRSFCDLKGWMPKSTIEKMKEIYGSVHDVELYTAVLAEHWVDGGIIGPTGAAILALQYRNLKHGDRYYFEHRRVAGSFTPDQLEEIKSKTSLARILCETTKISRIQPNVFLPASKSNVPVSCQELPELNLNYWEEEHCKRRRRH